MPNDDLPVAEGKRPDPYTIIDNALTIAQVHLPDEMADEPA